MSGSKAKGKRPNRPPSFLCVPLRTWRLCAQRRQVRKKNAKNLASNKNHMNFARPVHTRDKPQLDVAGLAWPRDDGNAGRHSRLRVRQTLEQVEQVRQYLAPI